MNIKEFRKKRVEGRAKLLEEIITTFKSLNTASINIFGSGTMGFKDEFSDIDIVIVFGDLQITNIISNLSRIFNNISPVLLRHHSKSWSPVGGSADSVIYDTKYGLFVVDYYIAKLSKTGKIELNSLGSQFLEKGALKLNRHVDKNIRDSHTLRNDIDLILDLIFISSKEIARNTMNHAFIKTIKSVHADFRKKYKNKIKRRQITLSYKSIYRLLSDLYPIANKRQRKAIRKMRRHLKEVELIYVT